MEAVYLKQYVASRYVSKLQNLKMVDSLFDYCIKTLIHFIKRIFWGMGTFIRR